MSDEPINAVDPTDDADPCDPDEAISDADIDARAAQLRASLPGGQQPLRLAEVRAIPLPADRAWRKSLHTEHSKAGPIIVPSVHNLLVILTHAPEFRGAIAYDEHRETVIVTRDLPWSEYELTSARSGPHADEWTDVDDTRLVSMLDRVYRIRFSDTVVHRAVNAAANANRVHPIRTYLSNLRWDGTPRLNHWLSTHLGCPDTAYEQAIGVRWLISAVARVFDPGCKADHVLVLDGPQGTGKSSALQRLAGMAWFGDDDLPIGTKDAAAGLAGSWIHELGEVGKLSGRSLDQVKAFVVRRVDKYRPSYGHRAQSFPRRCVFAGSSNDEQYLTDPTGGRRWWGVRCGRIDLDAISRDRDQLWAEAVIRYEQREPWHVDSAELAAMCTEQQESRRIGDPWEEYVSAWLVSMAAKEKLRTQGYLTTRDVIEGAIGADKDRIGKAEAMRIGAAMKLSGWARRQFREGTSMVSGYVPAVTDP